MGNRRILSFLLTLCLMISLMPVSVLAESEDFEPLLITEQNETITYAEGDGSEDNDELLDAYVQGLIDASLGQSKRRRSSVGAGLSGMDSFMYNYLKNAVAEIADGRRISSVITINRDELIAGGISCGPWTAAELNVSSIAENGSVSATAKNAAMAKFSFDSSAVLNALLVDCPSTLYWYNKAQGGGTGINKYYEFSAEYDYSISQYKLSIMPTLTVTMSVSDDYAGSEANIVDSSKVTTAQTAIANAVAIASGATGTVRDKLTYFKDIICEKAIYNYAAIGTAYGDPWQLIYVFDNDPDTNVVCEGYSKAFQYLFDLAGFADPYDCILVTGNMAGGTGAGPHMWNLVHMEDGNNYLVDVTNCDEGSVGAPAALFLTGCGSGSVSGGYVFRTDSGTIDYSYDDTTLSIYSNEMLTVPITQNTNIVTLSATAEFGNISISPSGVLYEGDEVTLTAAFVPGCDFKGWYRDGNQVCQNLIYTFTITENTELSALYSPNDDVTVTISSNGAYAISGDIAEDLGAGRYIVQKGKTLKFQAIESGKDVQWQNASQKIMGRNKNLEVTVVGDMNITLVYQTATSGSAYVQFVSDYGKVLKADSYDADSIIDFPENPFKFGYTFKNWVFEGTDVTADEAAIKERLDQNTIIVKPKYDKDTTTTFDVTVTFEGVERPDNVYPGIPVGDGYTVTAPEIDGKEFQYWKIDNNGNDTVLGYKRKYYFQVAGNTTLTAVYGVSSAIVLPVISISVMRKEGTDMVTSSATRSIPDGYRLLEHGMLYAKNFTGSTFDYDADNVKKYISNSTMNNGVVKLNFKVDSSDPVVTMRGYMILLNEDTGCQEKIYTDIVTGKYSDS